MNPAAALIVAIAMAAPAAARGLPDAMRPHTTSVPASAIAVGTDSAGALDEGRALLMAGNPAQALSAFQVALAQAPQSVAALNGIAIAYDRLGRSDLARQHFAMALALEPDAADIAHNLGLALVRAGQDREAIPHLQRAAAGRDARVAAAARRSLTGIAARLAMPPPAAAAVVTAGARIDMAGSGEAVLVLAPASGTPAQPAPVRMAADRPARSGQAAAARPSALANDMIDAGLADRLGDIAVLAIPMQAPAPPPEAPPEAPGMPLAPAARQGPPVTARRVIAAAPASPSASANPALPAHHPPAVVRRRPAALLVLAQWRRATPADAARPATMQPAPSPPPFPDDDRAAIRLAIARLESLIAVIEVQRG